MTNFLRRIASKNFLAAPLPALPAIFQAWVQVTKGPNQGDLAVLEKWIVSNTNVLKGIDSALYWKATKKRLVNRWP